MAKQIMAQNTGWIVFGVSTGRSEKSTGWDTTECKEKGSGGFLRPELQWAGRVLALCCPFSQKLCRVDLAPRYEGFLVGQVIPL